jgi:predicted AAA+ superfamily ATPase
MQFKKEFNSSGPNKPERHYTLERNSLIEKGKKLVYNDRYFTLFAPRQSGKSTFFQLLGEQLKTEGYKVCYTNFENCQNLEVEDFCLILNNAIKKDWQIEAECKNLHNFFFNIERTEKEQLILIVDNVEEINHAYLTMFFRGIRSVFHSRQYHAVKSIILGSQNNIPDHPYDDGTPFNANEELEVPYFTEAEILELLAMHETETGQLFSPKVKERICYMTAGQPGLVNGFAGSLVQLYPDVPVFEYEHYLEIEENYIALKINKNVSNIVAKAKNHRKFVEQLLFDELPRKYMIQDERIKELTVNGVITYNKARNIVFGVPLYRKCLHAAFAAPMNGEAEEIRANLIVSDYFTTDGLVNMDKIIREYQIYANRRGFRYFMHKDEKGKMTGLKEAALVYSFETYIQSFLQVVEGKSYLEPHVALGKSDLLVNIGGTEFVIEAKVFYSAVQFEKGKTQLAYYIKSLNLTTGVYLVFAKSTTTNPILEEADEIIEGIHITTYLVRYDVETDFSAPKRKKK